MTRVGQLARNVDAVSEPPQRSCSEPISPGRASHTRFLLDKLCHASLINAVRGGGQSGQGGYTFRTFPHNDLAKLDRMLTGADPRQLQVVVSESVFSMDGDCADLLGLAEAQAATSFPADPRRSPCQRRIRACGQRPGRRAGNAWAG